MQIGKPLVFLLLIALVLSVSTLFFLNSKDQQDNVTVQMVLIPSSEVSVGTSRLQQIGICKQVQLQNFEIEPYRVNCDNIHVSWNKPYITQVSAYYIDTFEVTFLEYVEFLNTLDVEDLQPFIYSSKITTTTAARPFNRWHVEETDAYLPAVNVTKQGAETFCAWRQKRLPSEAEWELAARGINGYLYPWGNEIKPGNANICNGECLNDRFSNTSYDLLDYPVSDNYIGLADVGSFPNDVSEFGVYDMAGNASEWVSGRFYSIDEESFNSNRNNPPSDNYDAFFETYIYKGGSYKDIANFPLIVGRTPATYNMTYGSSSLGFRCAKSVMHSN